MLQYNNFDHMNFFIFNNTFHQIYVHNFEHNRYLDEHSK